MIDLEKEILKLIGRALETPSATVNIRSGLGRHAKWDSLGHISIMVELEQQYHIEIKDVEIERILTVLDIIEFVKTKIASVYHSN